MRKTKTISIKEANEQTYKAACERFARETGRKGMLSSTIEFLMLKYGKNESNSEIKTVEENEFKKDFLELRIDRNNIKGLSREKRSGQTLFIVDGKRYFKQKGAKIFIEVRFIYMDSEIEKLR